MLNFVYYFTQAVSFPEILQFALERINPTTHISSDCCQQFLSLLFVSFLEIEISALTQCLGSS